MKVINFLTLFPNYYEGFKTESIIGKAIEKKLIEINVVNWRNYATDKQKKVDDEIYGGGQGMLLMLDPLVKGLKEINGYKILVSPQGKKFEQKLAKSLISQFDNITLVAGRYEGFDERILNYVDAEISIGDYILTGGELASMVIADTLIRLIPGVIKEASYLNESFENNLLDYAQFTKPRIYENYGVPEVLLNGNHQEIAKWRLESQITKTKKNRPDLYERYKNEK